jgi:hypothetical protein
MPTPGATDANDSQPPPPPPETVDPNETKSGGYILPPGGSCQIKLYKSIPYVRLQFKEFGNNAGLHIRSGMTVECRWNDVPPVESWCCRSSEWEACHAATDPNKVSIFGREYSPKTPECHLWCSGSGDDCFTFNMDPQSIEEQAGASCLWTSEGFSSVLGLVIVILACVSSAQLMLRVASWIRGLCRRRATPVEKFFFAPMQVVVPPRTRIDWAEEPGPLGKMGYWQLDVTAKNTFWNFFNKLKTALPPGVTIMQGETGSVVRFAHKDYAAVVEKTEELFLNHDWSVTKTDVEVLKFITVYPDTPRGVVTPRGVGLRVDW